MKLETLKEDVLEDLNKLLLKLSAVDLIDSKKNGSDEEKLVARDLMDVEGMVHSWIAILQGTVEEEEWSSSDDYYSSSCMDDGEF